MRLRSYQIEAVDRTFAAWKSSQSVLGVAATGLGKTILFAHVIKRHQGRVIVVAHREELIFQAANKIKAVTGHEPDIEMADMRAAEGSILGKAKVVVSTIQTQTAGRNGGRMHRFNPDEFDLLVIDEAHHAVSASYRKVIKHYRQNKNLRVLGVTATPDRSDEAALGQVFDDVAFMYDLRFGIEDGWLTPVAQTAVHAEGLDLSAIRTTAGDLNGKDLAKVMEYEANLHEIATPTIDLTKDGRKTLIFTASIAHAERLCEILNRHRHGSARWVSGKTPKKERRTLFQDYAHREFQYLLNVGVATEGFDDPGIEAIVMARPTKSRSLYAQMVGRGTRPLPGTVDHPDMFGSAKMRRNSIARSSKPKVEIIDFVGNAGRHKLVTTADILGGTYSQDTVERARANVEKDGSRNMMEALDEAEQQLRKEREEAEKAAAARRASLVADVKYQTSEVDPFDAFGITPWREKGWDVGRQPTEKMLAMLERGGVNTEGITYARARQLIQEMKKRWDSGKCTFKQAKLLAARGLSTDVSQKEATAMIDAIAKREGWGSKKRTTSKPPKPPRYERY